MIRLFILLFLFSPLLVAGQAFKPVHVLKASLNPFQYFSRIQLGYEAKFAPHKSVTITGTFQPGSATRGLSGFQGYKGELGLRHYLKASPRPEGVYVQLFVAGGFHRYNGVSEFWKNTGTYFPSFGGGGLLGGQDIGHKRNRFATDFSIGMQAFYSPLIDSPNRGNRIGSVDTWFAAGPGAVLIIRLSGGVLLIKRPLEE